MIVPRDQLFVHEDTQSYSLFSNYFRYQLLRRGLGLYIDCDVICVRPIDASGPYVFGYQDDRVINGAILKLPSDSLVLRDLERLFEKRVFTPPWYSRREQLKQYARAVLGRPYGIRHAPWGSAGPTAITWYVRQHDLTRHAEPPEVFYPVHWRDAAVVLDPLASWNAMITERTRCVHLWNENLRHHDVDRPPRSSPLRRFLDGAWP
jgi:mannosyltransferase OCH1-like enzyme